MSKQAYVIVVTEPDNERASYVLPDAHYDLSDIQTMMQTRMDELVEELTEEVPGRSFFVMLDDDKMAGKVVIEAISMNHLNDIMAEFSIQAICLPEGI